MSSLKTAPCLGFLKCGVQFLCLNNKELLRNLTKFSNIEYNPGCLNI